MSHDLTDMIRKWLQENSVAAKWITHKPTRPSKESALARGEELKVGGKALVVKLDGAFHLLVMSAALELDSAAIRSHFGVKKFRFANADEFAMLGLTPGAVPPFGPPILPLTPHVDRSILENQVIAFNAGSLTESVVMSVGDYMNISHPNVFHFAVAKRAAAETGNIEKETQNDI